jgi:hypothetical protein
MYLKQFKAKFENSRGVFRKKVEFCTNQEISNLEKRLNLTFPLAYKEFLLWGGKKAGGLMEGSDCFFENLELNQDTAKLILEDDNFPYSLPKDALVFFMHQDYQFLFFKTSDGDNPHVYSYQERQSKNSFKLEYLTYTSFLINILEKEAAWRKEWGL